jgi:hypothetical protein
MDLQGAYSLLATQHKVDYPEPSLQGIIRVLENSSHQDGEAITSSGTPALPMPGAIKFIDLIATAPWTPNAIWPAPGGKIGFAGVIVLEHGLKFVHRHLSDSLGFHRESPSNLDDYQDNTSKSVCQEVDNRLTKSPRPPLPKLSILPPQRKWQATQYSGAVSR